MKPNKPIEQLTIWVVENVKSLYDCREHHKIVPLLIFAVKELSDQIQSLQQQMQALQQSEVKQNNDFGTAVGDLQTQVAKLKKEKVPESATPGFSMEELQQEKEAFPRGKLTRGKLIHDIQELISAHNFYHITDGNPILTMTVQQVANELFPAATTPSVPTADLDEAIELLQVQLAQYRYLAEVAGVSNVPANLQVQKSYEAAIAILQRNKQ